MNDFDLKDSLIAKIRSYHPGQRPDKYKHYGWYTGGMTDTGDWYFEIMIRDSIENLQDCLELLENPNRDIDPDLIEMRRQEQERDEKSLEGAQGNNFVMGMFRLGAERNMLWPEQERLGRFKKNKANE